MRSESEFRKCNETRAAVGARYCLDKLALPGLNSGRVEGLKGLLTSTEVIKESSVKPPNMLQKFILYFL